MLGLSYENIDADYTSIDYCIYTYTDNKTRVFEKGVNLQADYSYNLGDKLRVERKSGKIKYYLNSTIIHTSNENPEHIGEPLKVDFAMRDAGTKIYGLKIGQNMDIANVLNTQDYYPFGMVMPGRAFYGSEDYRYGFNGMEKDNEIKNLDGSSLDFGARIYDPRVGRWLSTDKLEFKYPSNSTYTFAIDNPILFFDVDGNTIDPTNSKGLGEYRKAMLSTTTGARLLREIEQSKGTFVIRVVDEVLVDGGNAVSGLTESHGELHNGGTSEAYYDLTVIYISKGSYELNKVLEGELGKDYRDHTSSAILQETTARIIEEKGLNIGHVPNSGASLDLVPGQLSIDGEKILTEAFDFVDVHEKYDFPIEEPLDNETDEEYMNRVGVHETTHGRYDGLTSDRKKQEKRAYRNEKYTIKQQGNNRKQQENE